MVTSAFACLPRSGWLRPATSVNAINSMLRRAAYSGHEHLCILAKKWGATNFDGMLNGAALGGHERLCILAKKWIREVAGE